MISHRHTSTELIAEGLLRQAIEAMSGPVGAQTNAEILVLAKLNLQVAELKGMQSEVISTITAVFAIAFMIVRQDWPRKAARTL